MNMDNLEIHYFTIFYFLVALSSYFFLGHIIHLIKKSHPFLKKHHALSRTISVVLIVGSTRLFAIPLQKALEHVFDKKLDYTEYDVLQGYFMGKTMALVFLFIMILYLSK